MDSGRQRDATEWKLVAAHLQSLDPDAPTARVRLARVLGLELARKLLFALAPDGGRRTL
jgi:hypothetical protein